MMNDFAALKIILYQQCQALIDQRISTIREAIASAEEAAWEETKSSAGDKYETGRAMMQMEIEKNTLQLIQAEKEKGELERLDVAKSHSTAAPGSLVITDRGSYFISVGAGKINLAQGLFYAVSHYSPIGSALMNKKAGEEAIFQGKKIKIKKIF